jgi:hypothetical protein
MFGYTLAHVIGLLITGDASAIDPGPFLGANLYAFVFGKADGVGFGHAVTMSAHIYCSGFFPFLPLDDLRSN